MTRRVLRSLVLAALVACCLAAPAHAAGSRTHTHTVSYDRYSFSLDGQRVWLWSAEFHYFRLPNPDLWRDQLEKLKAAGFNTVSLYFSWAYHSPAPGVFDFSGVRDVDRLLDIAQEVGLYVIARPGPYINAELDSRRLPRRGCTTQAGPRPHQRRRLPGGLGAVVLGGQPDHRPPPVHRRPRPGDPLPDRERVRRQRRRYMEELKAGRAPRRHHRARCSTTTRGATCCGRRARARRRSTRPTPIRPASTATARRSRALTDYRFLRDGTSFNPPRPGVGDRPFFFAEFQGGAFDPWGGPGYDRCRALTGPAFERMFYANNIENQFTAQNLYMTYGGTNWGWQADPNVVYTSYDYGAAFSEAAPADREGRRSSSSWAHGRDGARPAARPMTSARWPSSNPAVRVWAKENPDTGRGSTSCGTPERDGRDRRHDDFHRGTSPTGRTPRRSGSTAATSRSCPPATTSSASGSSTRPRRSTRTCARATATSRCCTAGAGRAGETVLRYRSRAAREGARRRRQRRVGRRARRPAPELRARRARAGARSAAAGGRR